VDYTGRKLYFNRCDPGESLPPDDTRNVDLDTFEDGGSPIRGVRWAEMLAARLDLSNRPVCDFITGLPGSGMTTELRRVEGLLRGKDRPWLTVRIDGEQAFDLSSTIDVVDVLLAVQEWVRKEVAAAASAAGRAPASPVLTGEETTTPTSGSASSQRLFCLLRPDDEDDLAVADMRNNPRVRARVREDAWGQMTRFLSEVRDDLGRLDEQARALGFAGIVVLLDSLEKLRGLSTNWREVMDSAERLFVGGTLSLELPVHVLYTLPPALILERIHEPVHMLPCVRLRNRDGSPCAGGVDAAREIVRRRVPDEVFAELLGPKESIFQMRVEQLVARTGGRPRDLVRMLQSLLVAGDSAQSNTTFRRVLAEIGETYRTGLPTRTYPLLAQIAGEKKLSRRGGGDREAFEAVFTSGAVLSYQNGERWFDLHPAALDLPGIREMVVRPPPR
jgi:hypothetical protein